MRSKLILLLLAAILVLSILPLAFRPAKADAQIPAGATENVTVMEVGVIVNSIHTYRSCRHETNNFNRTMNCDTFNHLPDSSLNNLQVTESIAPKEDDQSKDSLFDNDQGIDASSRV